MAALAFFAATGRVQAGLVPCSTTDLVNAVQAAVTAGGAQPLDLAAGCTYTLSAIHTGAGFVNATGLPYIENGTNPVNLMFNGHGATITRDAGAPQFRFFLVFAGNRLELANLTLSGGRAPDSTVGQGGVGGAIDNFGTVTLSSVNLIGNRAGDGLNPGGAGFQGGYGGAIYNHDTGILSISNSAISNNTAGTGGSGATGGPGGNGGGLMTVNTTAATVANSTISSNTAGSAGSGASPLGGAGGGIYAASATTLINTTVAFNTAPRLSGGIARQSGAVSLRNTIVANNTGGNCSGAITNTGNNLDSGTTCGFGSANGSKSSANANLGALEDGALTRYHPLQVPSDAIDAGDDATCAAAPIDGVDQILNTRPQGPHCDIGAYEAGAVPPTATETTMGAPTETPTQPSGACAGPADALVSCWKGDSDATDSTGTNHGTLMNGAGFTTGRVGQAFSFNGASQFVQTTNAPSLDFERTAPFTIAAWLRTAETTRDIFVATKQANSAPYRGYGLALSNGEAPGCDASNPTAPGAGQLGAFLGGAIPGSCPPDYYVSVRGATHLNDGQWHHVAMTYDGSSAAAGVTVYVDGATESAVVQADTLDSKSILTTAPFTIGSRENGGVPFNGDIDEVEVFNRALSAAEIQAIYDAAPPTPTPVPGACAGPSNGRVSCWKGEGNASDSVDGNHGTLVNGTTFGSGIEGQAFDFDGSDDEIRVPPAPNLNPGGQITVAAWVKADSAGHGRSIVQKISASNIGGYVFESAHSPYAPNNSLTWAIWTGGTLVVLQAPADALAVGAWKHVAATFDGTAMKIYVDGIEVAAKSASGTIDAVNDPVVIGRNVVNPSYAWDGLLDEVQVWNRGLSAAEVREIVDAAPPCAGTEGTWLGNNHSYRAVCVRGRLTWDAAKTAAEAEGGYLATLTSSGENVFVFNLVDSPDLWYRNSPGASIGP